MTDGPYPEKDIIGGYSLIAAESIEQAVELSRGCPIFMYDGMVEVPEHVGALERDEAGEQHDADHDVLDLDPVAVKERAHQP